MKTTIRNSFILQTLIVLLFYVGSFQKSSAQANDNDGRPSETVKIGHQTWAANNLNVDRFNNGEPIPEAKTNEEWQRAEQNKQPSWCYPNNDTINGPFYGKLYNGYAVNDPRGLAPSGWHVSSSQEWSDLVDYLGGRYNAGKALKTISGWYENGNGTNSSGFSGLPSGRRNPNGKFIYFGSQGIWWCSDDLSRVMTYRANIVDWSGRNVGFGFSVRCLKD